MNVVHVTTWNERCGIATYTARLARELTQLGVEQHVVARSPASEPIALGELPVIGTFDPLDPDAAFGIAAACRAASVVHIQFNFAVVPPPLLVDLVPRLVRSGVRVVVTFHALSAPLDEAFAVRALPALRGSTAVLLGAAEWPLEPLARRFVRIVRVPHGVPSLDVPSVEEARARLGIDSSPVVSTAGFALPHKGLPRLVAALPRLAERFPRMALVASAARHPDPISDATLARCRDVARLARVEDRVHLDDAFLDEGNLVMRLAAGDVIALPYESTRELASGALALSLGTGRRVAVSNAKAFDAVRAFTHPLGGNLAADLAPLLAQAELEDHARRRRNDLQQAHGFANAARSMLAIYRGAA